MTDPTALPSFPPPRDDHPLRGRILDVLIDEGFRPDLGKDGDVSVKVQGQQLIIRSVDGKPDGSQPAMMRVFGQWQIGAGVPQDELARLRAANHLTARLNVVKVSVHDRLLLVSAEYLVFSGTDLRRLLLSTFQGLLGAVRLWHQQVTGSAPASGDADPAGGNSDSAGGTSDSAGEAAGGATPGEGEATRG